MKDKFKVSAGLQKQLDKKPAFNNIIFVITSFIDASAAFSQSRRSEACDLLKMKRRGLCSPHRVYLTGLRNHIPEQTGAERIKKCIERMDLSDTAENILRITIVDKNGNNTYRPAGVVFMPRKKNKDGVDPSDIAKKFFANSSLTFSKKELIVTFQPGFNCDLLEHFAVIVQAEDGLQVGVVDPGLPHPGN